MTAARACSFEASWKIGWGAWNQWSIQVRGIRTYQRYHACRTFIRRLVWDHGRCDRWAVGIIWYFEGIHSYTLICTHIHSHPLTSTSYPPHINSHQLISTHIHSYPLISSWCLLSKLEFHIFSHNFNHFTYYASKEEASSSSRLKHAGGFLGPQECPRSYPRNW